MIPIPISIDVRVRARTRGRYWLACVIWFLRWLGWLLPRRQRMALLRHAAARVRGQVYIPKIGWYTYPYQLTVVESDL